MHASGDPFFNSFGDFLCECSMEVIRTRLWLDFYNLKIRFFVVFFCCSQSDGVYRVEQYMEVLHACVDLYILDQERSF